MLSDDLVGAVLAETIKLGNAAIVWEEEGNLIVNMFGWLFEGVVMDDQQEDGIAPLINHEFQMYRHHLQNVNGKPNRGWLLNMVFGLTQPLV